MASSKSPIFSSISTLLCKVTSFFDKIILSTLSEIRFFILSLFINAYFSIKFSTFLNSDIKLEAVFTPIPGTPGTLSTLSPIRACTSITLSGVTPNFSFTLSTSMKTFLIGSYIFMFSETSCIKSLSEEKIVTLAPSLVAL